MTHLTPEDIEKIKFDLTHGCTYSYRWPGHRECMQMLFDAISERAALAGQVLVLRDLVHRFVPSPPKLDLPQAAQQVAEWKEKAEKWDALCSK